MTLKVPVPSTPATSEGEVREIPRVCRLLRAKTSYGASERGAEWKRGDSPTAVYWCLATMEPFGVDDSYCHPHQCRAGRSCFEPCPEDEEQA